MNNYNDITELYDYSDDYIVRETMVNKVYTYNEYYRNVMNTVFSELFKKNINSKCNTIKTKVRSISSVY